MLNVNLIPSGPVDQNKFIDCSSTKYTYYTYGHTFSCCQIFMEI